MQSKLFHTFFNNGYFSEAKYFAMRTRRSDRIKKSQLKDFKMLNVFNKDQY